MSDDANTILQILSLKINSHLQQIRALNQEKGDCICDKLFSELNDL